MGQAGCLWWESFPLQQLVQMENICSNRTLIAPKFYFGESLSHSLTLLLSSIHSSLTTTVDHTGILKPPANATALHQTPRSACCVGSVSAQGTSHRTRCSVPLHCSSRTCRKCSAGGVKPSDTPARTVARGFEPSDTPARSGGGGGSNPLTRLAGVQFIFYPQPQGVNCVCAVGSDQTAGQPARQLLTGHVPWIRC